MDVVTPKDRRTENRGQAAPAHAAMIQATGLRSAMVVNHRSVARSIMISDYEELVADKGWPSKDGRG